MILPGAKARKAVGLGEGSGDGVGSTGLGVGSGVGDSGEGVGGTSGRLPSLCSGKRAISDRPTSPT